jgi:anti-sigma regulatory factor (Ser/Thr protein kinase)
LELAMQEGYSTAPDSIREMGFGAGMGLSNIKKHSDLFEIKSVINKGTTVLITVFFKQV